MARLVRVPLNILATFAGLSWKQYQEITVTHPELSKSKTNDSTLSSALRNLTVTYRRADELVPYDQNARTHSKRQIEQIATSMQEFGFTNPILIDSDDRIIAGHGRVDAAKLLGFESVPTICLDHMTEAQRRAYIIADNRLAENAGWDENVLALELQYLLDADIEFDITVTGFETPDIDLILSGRESDDDQGDHLPETPERKHTVSQKGDLWILGGHRLLCADALDVGSFEVLMRGDLAEMVFTDPPYNVPIDGHVCGLGAVHHEEFGMASGEMSEESFTTFLKSAFENLASHSVNGSIHFICMDWRHLYEIVTAGRDVYSETKNVCIWNKSNGGMGSLYRSKHELVFVFKNGDGRHINNVELGRHGRNRTNVWDYPGVNSFGEGRAEALEMHPTVKPVSLVADAIIDCSNRNGIILDAFAGSGTTILAAERAGRRARCIELDPRYVDVAIQRWQELTGKQAIEDSTGSNYAALQEERWKKNETEAKSEETVLVGAKADG